MPPKEKLKDREIAALSRWVAMGLPWPEAKAATPAIAVEGRSPPDRRNSGDSGRSSRSRLSRSRPSRTRPGPGRPSTASSWRAWRSKGFGPAAPADKRTLIRRATFDLTGLPPTPEEVEAFLADESPDAFARVVDRLLASPRYGERWGRHWLDVVRYADARDLIQLPAESDFREAWRYRDWVVAAFNRDLPYAEFVRDQVAGDLLPPPASRRDQRGRARRHRPAGHRRLRPRRRGQGADDRRLRQRPDRRRRPGLPRADHRLRPLPRPQVRPDLHRGLLRPGGHLLQHPADPRPGARQHAAGPRAAPAAGRARQDRGAGRRGQAAAGGARATASRRGRPRLPRPPPQLAHPARRPGISSRPANTGNASTEQAKPSLAEAGEAARASRGLAGRVGRLSRPGRRSSSRIGRHPIAPRRRRPGKLAGPALAELGEDAARRTSPPWPRRQAESARSPGGSCPGGFVPDPLPGGRSAPRHRSEPAGSPSGRTAPACPRTPGRSARPGGPCKAERRDQRAHQDRAPVRRPGPARAAAPGARDRQPVRRLPDRGFGRARPAPASAGKIPTSASTGWAMLEPGGRLQAVLRNDGKVGRPGRYRARPRVSRSSASPGARGHDAASQRGGGRVARRGSMRSPPTRPSRRSDSAGRAPGAAPGSSGDLAELRVYDRQLDEAERQQVEAELRAAWFDTADPKRPRAIPWPNSTRNCSRPAARSGCPADERTKLLPPRSGPGWTS